MIESIKYHLSHIADFAGREGRTTFWLWLLAVAIVNILVSVGMGVATAASAIGTAFEVAKQGEAAVETAVMEQMMPNMGLLVWTGIAMSAFNCVVMGAAIVRRLRDGGLPALLVLIPLVAVVLSSWFAIEQIGSMQDLVREAMADGGDLSAIEEQAGFKSLVGWIPLLFTLAIGFVPSRGRAAD